jgi:hypothetical protein
MAVDTDGYGKIVNVMADYPEFAIFRRFQKLNILNLLYLQAELVQLEAELQHLAAEDASAVSRQDYAHDWWTLAHGDGAEGSTLQWQKALEVREKLKEYSTTSKMKPHCSTTALIHF